MASDGFDRNEAKWWLLLVLAIILTLLFGEPPQACK